MEGRVQFQVHHFGFVVDNVTMGQVFFFGYESYLANIVLRVLQSCISVFVYHRRYVILAIKGIFKQHTYGSFTDIHTVVPGWKLAKLRTHTHTCAICPATSSLPAPVKLGKVQF